MLKRGFITVVDWTPEMDAALVDLRAERAGYVRCAARIGVGSQTVAKRVRQLGLPKFSRGQPTKVAAQ